MRTASPGRALPVALCIFVLAITVASTYSIAGGASAAKHASGTITIALPECDAAVQKDADGLCRFTGTGFQQIGQTGEPSIPYQSVRVLLPPNADLATVKATITGSRWALIDSDLDVRPVPPLAVGSGDQASVVWPADKNIVEGKDTDIYESDALFPLEPVRKVDVQLMRGWKMVQILYAPYAYNPVEKRVFRLSGDDIQITFESESLKISGAVADLTDSDRVREMTVNFAEVSGEYGSYAASADTGRYVIITTDNIEAASSNLIDFVASKEARGFTVQVVTEGTWGGGTGNTAAENIRSWLKNNYFSLNIKYVLLIGNPNPSTGDVPMKMCYCYHTEGFPPVTTTYDVPTDFYYAELTSDDWDSDGDGKYGEYDDDFSGSPPRAAEVAVGRIPYYGSITDLDHILSKIIAYETASETDIAWRKNTLLPMKPSDDDTPGYQLGEEIKDDILIPSGWTYRRVYDETYGLTPPPETTPCTVTNVTNAWNGSDFGAVFWWTHGSSMSASYVMDLSHAATLDDAHPGFAFQCSCSNGTPEASNNLGYSLLKNGCVSTVAASRVSWYEIGQTSFAGSATNSGMTREYSQRLIAREMYAGDALNGLKSDISPGFEELWMNYLDFNLYGCPAIGPFTSMPDEASPSVITYYARNIDTVSARPRANLTSLGTADNVSVSFQWGTSSGAYANETDNQTMTETGAFYFDLTGLTPGTTYYYRPKATGSGTAFGLEKTFSTLTTPPSVTTDIASTISAASARLNGNLDYLGTATSVSVSFEWAATSGGPYTGTTSGLMSGTGAFHFDLAGLIPITTYYYRAKAAGHGTSYGAEKSFTTLTMPPSVTTSDVSNVATTSATLNGSLTSKGTASSVTVSFVWGTTAAGPYPNSTGNQTRTTTGTFFSNRSGLTPGTTYYYRAKADGDGDPVYGDEKSFTASTTLPLVTTDDPSNITTDGARLNGSLSSNGTAENVTLSFQWGTTPGDYDHETAPEVRTSAGTFYFDLSGLANDAPFYYRAKAVGHGDPVYGDEKSFTTGTTPPSVSTDDPGNVTADSAQINGSLTDRGTAQSVTVSFEWGTTSGGPYEGTAGEVLNATGTFHFDLASLTPETTYYYRAKAVGAGAVYGTDEKHFTTLPAPLSVTTNDATSLTTTAATLNGEITALGTSASATVSFEYGVATGGPYTPVAVGVRDAVGSFTANVNGLSPGTTYYYVAKAVGDGSPVSGLEKTFTTLQVPHIANVNPGTGGVGQSLVVGISGSDFAGLTTVSLGPEIIVDRFTLVSDTQISAAIRILCDVTPGVRDVSVTTPAGTATLTNGFSATDSTPNQPQNVAPVDKAGVMTLTPSLSSSVFSHPCLSCTHAASQWQVTTVSGDYSNPLFDRAADSVNLTSLALPSGIVDDHELYWWRVRYQDSRGHWSDWSNETRFARPDFLTAGLDGSAEIRARDSSSRVTGSVDGELKEGIPYSDYFSDTVTVISPTDSYRYEVVGTEDGSYTLTVVRLVGDQSLSFHATGIPVSAGEVHQYVIDWDALSRGEDGVTIRIDSDGNGTIDKTIPAKDEISSHEFVAAMNGHQTTPIWVWICLGLLAASSGVFALSRVAGKRPQADAPPQ